MRLLRRRRTVGAAIGLWTLLGVTTPPARADQDIAFVTVALDSETRQADRALARYLTDTAHLQFDAMPMEYEEAIRRLVGWKRGGQPYLARLTPYAYVAAELLGANFNILGTYNSKATSVTTYHSYFVVNRKSFSQPNPGLGNLVDFLRSKPATFIYHDKFSASGYFLPSLYFRSQRVFATNEDTESADGIVPIQVIRESGASSSVLVERVAHGDADVAAVWDGTKQKFENGPIGKQVHFIQLPDPIPNDLLVCSRWLNPADTTRLREAIRAMSRTGAGEINIGDYRWWDEFNDAGAARMALAKLRRIAAERPAPVTVLVEMRQPKQDTANVDGYIEAAQQAIRLSGSELVLYDRDAYIHKDVTWTLTLIHDLAVELEVDIAGSMIPAQRFHVSFTDLADLTKRIGVLIHSRMHRIRYVWPYDERSPTVIRDVNFSIPVGTALETRRITWLDPERNAFREGDVFDAQVREANFFKFSLDDARFPRLLGGTGWASDPMSNSAYRVVLVRPSTEPFMMQVLTGVLILLLVGAAAVAVVDVRRREQATAFGRLAEPVVALNRSELAKVESAR